jgi:DNA mismatch endonuclease, patch repair protein
MGGSGRTEPRSIIVADVFSQEKRSHVMGRIRSTGNKETEIKLIQIMRRAEIIGWRRRVLLPGRPDFVFRKQRVALFVDGCFWHGCPIHGRQPKSNVDYWARKLERNRNRDREVSIKLKMLGWTVIRIWHHELSASQQKRCIAKLRRVLLQSGLRAIHSLSTASSTA